MPKKRNHGDGALYFDSTRRLWRGVIDVGFHPDGRRRQKAVTSKSQRVARDKLNELKKQIAEHGTALNVNMTMEKWADKWLTEVCEPNMKPKALQSYESAVRHWILPSLGKRKVASINPSDVRAVTRAVTDAGRATSSARKVQAVLSSMMEAARLDGLCARNPAEDVKAPSIGDGGRGALSTEQALRILEVAARRPDGTRWWVALLAGMRQGERLGATRDSPDFNTHEFHVQWSLTEVRFRHGCGGTCSVTRAGNCPERVRMIGASVVHKPLEDRLCLVRPKSGKVRSFPLIEALEVALQRYIENDDRYNPHNLIWHNDDGSPITPKQDMEEWKQILLAAGVITHEQTLPEKERPEGTPPLPTTHWARHTTVTVLMELGVDARVIGEIVGHASVQTTRRYTHVSSQQARTALEALGENFQLAITD